MPAQAGIHRLTTIAERYELVMPAQAGIHN